MFGRESYLCALMRQNLHLPTALSEDGLPLGVQLVGKPGTDRELIGWALALHKFVDRRICAEP
ncbi:hypothetical protein GNZ13_35495 [Paraburkholderia sp. 5N]|uniref:Amidase domain-containing protein n=1 Tax=Paraburkholderia elongata TaxID=2675747 RepID=A0A972NU32_9BURK|nr:hypothetical protein [Paraburkholderia elongata]